MPSLKMKTKSTTGCLGDKNSLRVCQNSSVISKNSLSRLKISQQTAVCEASFQNVIQDVSLCDTACAPEIGGDEAVDHCRLLVGENLQFQKQLSSTMGHVATGNMESLSSINASNYETIFSPSLEYNGLQSEQNACTVEGRNNDFDASQLRPDGSDDHNSSVCEYQTCNVSDFYISDMIVSSFPVEGSSVNDDTIEATSLHDYTCDEPNVFCDVADEFMMLPLLEDTVDTGGCLESRTCGEPIVHADNSGLYLAIHQLRTFSQESDVDTFLDLDPAEYFDPHIFIRNLPDLPDVDPSYRPATLPPKETRKSKSVTLVLDLDETLVHSSLEQCDDADFTFPVYFNMKEHIVYVKQRPYLWPFLERVAEMFEIVVFTASQSIYAKQLLDILDPHGKLISRRAYRESCIFTDGSYTKDLTVLGVDLAKVAIIDNSPQVFRLQVNNGIPIKSWFDDPSDRALISLLPFLETLVDADDVRPIIAKRFGNKE